ncbi:hypothetical protein CspeluHIS016_0205100 [Cutaneotrichosporon spelunceum]|uniref:Glutathione S-transferase UstS-like C-terminal domain-containing protein n=1 Tax=Cutaneotrichosporon spelunceum TaxID=1672016 RepID=A0AAD3TRK0_9TREE|nr:hypothetical protein CspeluHIS016_0205100 [Cutaneotrichosporon spelunceum]
MTTDPVTLYCLSLLPGKDVNVGPYPWKTAIDLGSLGVPWRFKGLTIEEIRTTFEANTAVKGITVPAIQDGEKWVFDSFPLAQLLNSKYGTEERTLFPAGEEFARLFDTWADRDLAAEVIPLLAPWLFKAQQPASAAWLVKEKMGGDQSKMDGLVNATSDPAFIEKQAAAIRAKLITLERTLQANKDEGKGQFIAGNDHPSHADAAVWGWYGTLLAVNHMGIKLGPLTFKHETLPLVGAWADAVQKAAGVDLQLEQ